MMVVVVVVVILMVVVLMVEILLPFVVVSWQIHVFCNVEVLTSTHVLFTPVPTAMVATGVILVMMFVTLITMMMMMMLMTEMFQQFRGNMTSSTLVPLLHRIMWRDAIVGAV